MARDQFQRVRPGDRLPGLPSQPWNAMLDSLKGAGIGARGPGEGYESAVEVLVVNTTGSVVGRGGILQVNAPLVTRTQDENQFHERDALRGVAPAADKEFVIFREPVSAGAAGWARIMGLVRVQVSITDASHEWAAPTTSTAYLTSQADAGPVRILHADGGGSGSLGVRWCTCLKGAGGGGDEIDLAELYSSGTSPPAGWLDARTLNADPATKTLSQKALVWVWDATT